MNIYFIRHWETDRNLKWMINPWDVDSELNQTWITQAYESWNNIKTQWLSIDVIISSPLKRAKKTAEIIAKEIGYKEFIHEIKELEEKYAGIFKDYYKKQFQEEFWCRIVEEILQKYNDKTFDWVESFKDFKIRIDNAIESIKNNTDFKGKNILIVSHWWVWEILTWIKKIDNCKLVKIN